MRRRKFGGAMAALLSCLAVVSGCGSDHKLSAQQAGEQLASRVIAAPYGYSVDSTPAATGSISPAVFDQFGGFGTPSKVGFVAGFKQDFVDYSTEEGIDVTVLEFRSAPDAAAYFKATATKTLSFAAATDKPYQSVPGAIEADGTKSYSGEYAHAVVMTNGKWYAQLAYFTAAPAPTPIEFSGWVKTQYLKLR
jgi:hypothetical protein